MLESTDDTSTTGGYCGQIRAGRWFLSASLLISGRCIWLVVWNIFYFSFFHILAYMDIFYFYIYWHTWILYDPMGTWFFGFWYFATIHSPKTPQEAPVPSAFRAPTPKLDSRGHPVRLFRLRNGECPALAHPRRIMATRIETAGIYIASGQLTVY